MSSKAPLHDIMLVVTAFSLSPDPPPHALHITGLHLHGAAWNGTTLVEMNPHELYAPLPPLRMIACLSHTTPPRVYECPVYPTGARARNGNAVVVVAELPCAQGQEGFWLLRGAAAVLQPHD